MRGDELRHVVEVEPEHAALDLLAGEHRRLAFRGLEARPLGLLDARHFAHEASPRGEPFEHLGIAEIEAIPNLVERHEGPGRACSPPGALFLRPQPAAPAARSASPRAMSSTIRATLASGSGALRTGRPTTR